MSHLVLVPSHHLTNRLSYHLPSYTTSELTVRKYSYSCSTPLMGKGREIERVLKKKMCSRAMVDDSCSRESTASDRPLANFHSTVWGDYFLSYTPELTKINIQEKYEHEELKEKVRQMLVETPDNSTQKLVLIDTIQRLGVAYHFQNEIQTSIQHIFDVYQQSENDEDNLYVAALRFRLVRQQRHYMFSDVFKKFTNNDGKFKEALTKDVQGLLSLYEAAHLRVHGEDILEEAMTFTMTHLESMLPYLSNSLKAQVSEALKHPIHTYLPRLTTRNFICMYENIESHNDSLLKFAKLDFNMLQRMHQRELGELTKWWKDLDFATQFPYARDRLVECYFWTVAPLYLEHQHSHARKLLTKVLIIFTVIDDTYDAYATYEELVLFTDAIDRLDDSAMVSVPSNLRPAYRALLDRCNEIEEKLIKEGKLDRLNYAKYEMKRLCRAYFKEAQWLNAGHIPKCEEYMKDAAITSATVPMIATTSLCVMEESTSKATFEWMKNEPLIVRASSVINRLKDDINSHSFEQQRSHVASFIECYMKEFGASKQEAYVEAQKEITNAWKDMNKDFLCSPEVPTCVLELVINLARLAYIFEQGDFINTASEFKGIISMLFVEPLNI